MYRRFRRSLLLLLFCATFLVVLLTGFKAPATEVSSDTTFLAEAQRSNQQGFAFLAQGQSSEALRAWQRSTQLYQQARDQEGIIGSQFNQTLALQALGLYPRACSVLSTVLQQPDWLCLPPQQITQIPKNSLVDLQQELESSSSTELQLVGYRLLGTVLRYLGKTAESDIVLSHAYKQASRLNLVAEQVRILQAIAATHQVVSDQTRDDLLRADSPNSQEQLLSRLSKSTKDAVNSYQQVIEKDSGQFKALSVQSRLNLVQMAVNFKLWRAVYPWQVSDLDSLNVNLTQIAAAQLVNIVQTPDIFSQLTPIESVYGKLSLANSLLRAAQDSQFDHQLWQGDTSRSSAYIRQLIQQVKSAPITTTNNRVNSFAIGLTAALLRQEGAPVAEYLQQYQQAAALAQSVQAWDVAYRWQGEVARIYRNRGEVSKAIPAYQATIASLDNVRQNILSVNLEVQLSFREQVEPVYREFMEVLLTQPNPNLQDVVKVNESLQVAELENFLRCGRLDYVSFNRLSTVQDSPTIIHIINLPSRTEVIVQSPNNQFYSYSRDPRIVRQASDNLLVNLQSPSFLQTELAVFLGYSRELYQTLLAPAMASGLIRPNATLVFVLDSLLQNIPMSILHDGNAFLIENYRVSVALSSQVREPRKLNSDQLEALIAGLSKAGPSFRDPQAPQGLAPLPEVESEIQAIRPYFKSSIELLNESFTVERFQRSLQTSTYPIIHVTTHGQFSSDPFQTVLLAWSDLISAPQLNQLIRYSSSDAVPDIEMMVLSACQTAKGDRRSTLGIAGLAVQAGARSTVASLWLVDSDSTSVLMSEFYKYLARGETKAEALRQAQLTLLKSSTFNHPFFWAPFILVGNWL